MADARICLDCDSPLPIRAPEGLCPRCLLAVGMAGAASASSGGLLDTIAATLGGSVPRVLLRDTGAGEVPSPLVRPASPEMPAAPGRLQLFGEIARGGMGAVLKGRDPDLGRELAVKVLLEGHRDNPDLVRRFVEEAQIAGQLQHPGVAPVYEMGRFADARPYFSMKLVKGHTLAEVLAGRADPADGLSGHVATWLQVCQTVAYAHARGVIHRDLKPSNIMLGGFGEVQVMDWGLAKVLARGGVVDDATAGKRSTGETVIATARSGGQDDDLSRYGSIMGTPSYMAPEQARGETDVVDERADVFALGSILCEVLTGRPAFTGRTSAEIQRKAARGDTAEALARLDACGADADLVDLARSCLSPREDDRPRDAGAVATRGLAYTAAVEAKLRRAELRSVEERARRRLTSLAAAATILLMLIGGGGYAWAQQQKSARIARTARAVDAALADAARLRGEALAAPPGDLARWAEAVSAARRAEELLAQGEADAPLRDRVATLLAQLDREQADAAEKARQVAADRALLAALDAIRGNRFGQRSLKGADAAYAAAFRAAGFELDAADPVEVGRRLAARSEPVELAGHLDEWGDIRQQRDRPEADWRRLVAAARAADRDPWRDAVRARVGSRDDADAADLRRKADDQAMLAAQPAASLVLLARQLGNNVGDRDRAAGVLRQAVLHHPDDFLARIELAGIYGASSGGAQLIYPRPQESVRHLTAAVAIRPGSSEAHTRLGIVLSALGTFAEATDEFREAVRLQPDNAVLRNSLAMGLMDLGRFDESITELLAAIRLQPNYLRALGNLRYELKKHGKLEEVLAAYRAVRERTRADTTGAFELAEGIRVVERLIPLAPRLPAILSGAEAPRDATERLWFAMLCHDQGLEVAATRLSADAFALDPRLADDLAATSPHGSSFTARYAAAFYAASAGCGNGRAEPPLDETARAKLRGQAREWIAADRDFWAKRLDSADPATAAAIVNRIRMWKDDGEFVTVRDAAGLAALPPVEAEAWRALWADVDALLQRAEAKSR